MVNDPIGDFLSRIRNALMRKKETVEVPSSKMLVALAEILKNESFISDYEVKKADELRNVLVLKLRYVKNTPVITSLKRRSRPGIRRYTGYRDIKPLKSGMGISVFSTPKGVITGKDAVKAKVGGEYICDIY